MSTAEPTRFEQWIKKLQDEMHEKTRSMFEASKQWTVRLLLVSICVNLVLFTAFLYDPYPEYHVVEMNPPPWASSYAVLVPEGSGHQPPVIMRRIPESGLLLVPSELNATQCTLRIIYCGCLEDGAHVEKTIVTTYQLSDKTRLGEVFTP